MFKCSRPPRQSFFIEGPLIEVKVANLQELQKSFTMSSFIVRVRIARKFLLTHELNVKIEEKVSAILVHFNM